MNRKRKGFTLVELLAVLVILAIILIIAVPGVLSIINKTKDNAYDRQIDMIKEATINYITANAITWNGDNPKSTLVTLDMLQSSGYLDKKLLDPRNKQEILCANVLVTKNNKNKINYDVDMTCNEIQPINPRTGSGMIPIVYDNAKATWMKADVSNKNFSWFNYGNQQWANVATVTEDVRQTLMDAPIGTQVPMEKINTMFTWIPRYKYKLFNVDGTISPVGNVNLAGEYMIDIKFETTSTTKSTGTQNGQWLTHPAFTFGGQELEGFWFGKFETGYNGATDATSASITTTDPSKVLIRPNSYAWVNNPFKFMFDTTRGMERNKQFGTELDSHVTKNMEWGAMTYLTYSRYGKIGNNEYYEEEKNPRVNNNSNHITGCGASVQRVTAIESCNPYDTVHGQAASTTGNISGIYDTNGGVWDYVAGVQLNEDGTHLIVSGSKFTQEELDQLGNEGKYFDIYQYNAILREYSTGKLGDASIEMAPVDPISHLSMWDRSAPGVPVLQSSFLIRGMGIHDLEADFENGASGVPTGACAGGSYENRGWRISLA